MSTTHNPAVKSAKNSVDWSDYNNSKCNGAPIGGNHPGRSKELDRRLSELVSRMEYAVPMSLGDIAKECGVSKAAIQQVEMKAFKNIRKLTRNIAKELL